MQRRAFLNQAFAACAAPMLLPHALSADISIGSGRLQTLSDGMLTQRARFVFSSMPTDEVAQIKRHFKLDDTVLNPACNITLWRDGDRLVLFDCGAGPQFQRGTGRFLQELSLLGLAPEDITHVIFTHAHPDHLWGVIDDFDDPLFYNAAHFIGAQEWAYWRDPDTVHRIGRSRISVAVGAERRLKIIENQISLIRDGQEVIPGVIAQRTPGHTPGHMSYILTSGNAQAMILGDAIGNHHAALFRPALLSGADQDMQEAAQTRIDLLDQITSDDILVTGFHFNDGGIGYIRRTSQGYRFEALG